MIIVSDENTIVMHDSGSFLTIALPSSASWISIAYGNGMFVAVATDSAIAASSFDGITWTARALPSSAKWSSVAYGNGMFVAIAGPSNVAATSPDGITWTARTLPSSQYWIFIAYGNGIFIAVTTGNSPSNVAATSPDGITWTARTMPSSQYWASVAYGNGMFVAIGDSSTVAASSPDGITWTARTLPSSAGWRAIAYDNGIFVVVAGGTAAASSSDGVTWTTKTLPYNATDEHSAVPTWVWSSWGHLSSFHFLASAKYIWESYYVIDPTVEATVDFQRTFQLSGSVTDAILYIGADDHYTVWLNGNYVGTHGDWQTTESYDVAAFLQQGANVLTIEGVNSAQPTTDPTLNPAMIVFQLNINGPSDVHSFPWVGRFQLTRVP